MDLDFYEVMKKALEVAEPWKKYYPFAQEVWRNARNRERLAAALITGPDLNPEDLEKSLTFIQGSSVNSGLPKPLLAKVRTRAASLR
jgi:hypothetical protein